MNSILKNNLHLILALCRKYEVTALSVFGSSLNSDENRDFDFVLRFGDIPLKSYADNYFKLKEELESLLGKKVDLVEEETITNPYFRGEVDLTRENIYG